MTDIKDAGTRTRNAPDRLSKTKEIIDEIFPEPTVRYRLKNIAGSETIISPLSNIVTLVAAPEASSGTGYHTYVGANPGANTGKSITWQLKNIDTNYELIDLIVVFMWLDKA